MPAQQCRSMMQQPSLTKSLAMKIATFFRPLTSRLYWVIHCVWLVVLAVGICTNVAFDYSQLHADELRLLLSENSIAANLVKAEVAGINALLETVESIAVAPLNPNLLADRLPCLTRSHPYVASITVESNGSPVASYGTPPSSPSAVFTRSISTGERSGLTVSIALEPGFWENKLGYVFGSGYAKIAIYTASGLPLLPFSGVSQAGSKYLTAKVVNMVGDMAALHTRPVDMGTTHSRIALRRVAAPFFSGGPIVVAALLSGDNTHFRWRSNALVQALVWLIAAGISTALLMLESRRRHRLEDAAAKMSANIREREKFIGVLMEHAPIMVSYWDAECRCHYANKMYRAWFGKTLDQLEGMDAQTLLGENRFSKCAPLIVATLRGEPQCFEQKRVKADGSAGYVLSRYIPDMDGQKVKGIFVISSDITELKKTQLDLEKRVEELHSLATTDMLTGLSNRRNLLEKAQIEIEKAMRYELEMVFLMLDIDHFKRINDTYGHDTGDAVLKGLGALLLDAMRIFDHVGRLGGEEFGILLTSVKPELAADIAERLRKLVESTTVYHNEWEIQFTVSIGLANLHKDVENPLDDMMKRADVALYRAKQEGRNCVCLADDLMPSA